MNAHAQNNDPAIILQCHVNNGSEDSNTLSSFSSATGVELKQLVDMDWKFGGKQCCYIV